jgi:hypothetical protein
VSHWHRHGFGLSSATISCSVPPTGPVDVPSSSSPVERRGHRGRGRRLWKLLQQCSTVQRWTIASWWADGNFPATTAVAVQRLGRGCCWALLVGVVEEILFFPFIYTLYIISVYLYFVYYFCLFIHGFIIIIMCMQVQWYSNLNRGVHATSSANIFCFWYSTAIWTNSIEVENATKVSIQCANSESVTLECVGGV